MKIAVLLSGGVDSSVALHLLQRQGYDLTAFYLKIWLQDELSFLGSCPWEEDLSYVRAVCDKLGVPLEVVSLQKEYWDHVVNYALVELKAGRTPNPDMLCNQRIKFGMFYSFIDDSFSHIATGHYAQKIDQEEVSSLIMSPDAIKDQTYFLAQLSRDQLKRALFPIGHLTKSAVRAYAKDFDLPTAQRPDSQGICFLGKFKFNDFVRHHLGEKTGSLVEWETGKIIGTHQGFWFFTIGQRQGIGLAGGPWYVVAKDHESNTVFLSRTLDFKENSCFMVSNGNWLTNKELSNIYPLTVKVRHGPHRSLCTVEKDADRLHVNLDTYDHGIASGQFAVFYDGNQCLGGGMISLDTLKK